MKFLKYLNEEYVTLGHVKGDTFPIFKNPTAKEMRECDTGYGIRFIVDTKMKDLYCFNGGTIHDYAFTALKFDSGGWRFWPGLGEYKNGKILGILVTQSDLDNNYPWLKRYIIPSIKA